MTEKPWKRHEREIAQTFDTERVLEKGRGAPDFETETVVGEVKSRQSLPKWLKDAVAQAWCYVLPFDGKMPVVCLKERGTRGFLVVIHSDDFMDWYGELPLRQMDGRCRELLCPIAIAKGLNVSSGGVCTHKQCPKGD